MAAPILLIGLGLGAAALFALGSKRSAPAHQPGTAPSDTENADCEALYQIAPVGLDANIPAGTCTAVLNAVRSKNAAALAAWAAQIANQYPILAQKLVNIVQALAPNVNPNQPNQPNLNPPQQRPAACAAYDVVLTEAQCNQVTQYLLPAFVDKQAIDALAASLAQIPAPIAVQLLQDKSALLALIPKETALYPLATSSDLNAAHNPQRPRGYAFVCIVTTGPNAAPIHIAEAGTGNAADYTQLGPLNPQFGGDWTKATVNDCINVPWSWAPNLQKAGFTVHQDADAGPGTGVSGMGVGQQVLAQGTLPEIVGAVAAASKKRAAARPIGTPFVRIRDRDKVYPFKLAEIGSGIEAKKSFPHLVGMNPHLVTESGLWPELRAGDEVNVPASWAERLDSRGFEIH